MEKNLLHILEAMNELSAIFKQGECDDGFVKMSVFPAADHWI